MLAYTKGPIIYYIPGGGGGLEGGTILQQAPFLGGGRGKFFISEKCEGDQITYTKCIKQIIDWYPVPQISGRPV